MEDYLLMKKMEDDLDIDMNAKALGESVENLYTFWIVL
jgi:hypothetical protein